MNVIFEWYLLRIMVFLVMGWSAENLEESWKYTDEKQWKLRRKENEDYVESQIATIYIFSFKLYFPRKTWFEKMWLVPSNFILVAGYLKHSSDTPNPDIHKYTNYDRIEIYINRLSTTIQISIAMDCLIMMSEKCLYFRKRKNMRQGHFLPTL